jgi:hypothetical protein
MNVSDLSVLGLLHERWSSDVVPHLSGHHGEDEEQRDQAPHVLVVQKLKIVAAEVEKTGNLYNGF